jgi:uncharacterized protein YuzE
MKIDYDSEADAISIQLCPFEHFDHGEQVDGDFCNVGIVNGKVVEVELLSPAKHLDLLRLAADRYGLDGTALLSAAQAGLAAPDRLVTVEVGASLLEKVA